MKEDKFEKSVFKDTMLFTGWALVFFMAGVIWVTKPFYDEGKIKEDIQEIKWQLLTLTPYPLTKTIDENVQRLNERVLYLETHRHHR